MVISAEPIIYGLIFVAVLALVNGIYLTVFGKSISLNNRVNRRLEMLEKGAGREQVLEQLRKEMSQHMKSKSIPLYAILAEKAQKANIAFTPSQLIMVMAVLGRCFCVAVSWHRGVHRNSPGHFNNDGRRCCVCLGEQYSQETTGPDGRTTSRCG